MASGQVGDEIKFFFHCQLADKSAYAMAEIVFLQTLRQVRGTVKISRGDLNQQIGTKFEQVLGNFTQ